MIVELMAPNQMATGVIGTPVYLLLLIFPIYGDLGIGFMENITRFLPTYYYFEILHLALDNGENLVGVSGLLLILTLFIIIFFIILKGLYRKVGLS